LREKGLDVEIINKAGLEEVSLADVYELDKAQKLLHEILEDVPSDLDLRVRHLVEDRLDEFFETTPVDRFFKPTLVLNRANLDDIPKGNKEVTHSHPTSL
jgi:hypothetical protein